MNDLSRRIHLDWWGQCRTCKHWSGNREKAVGGGHCTVLAQMGKKDVDAVTFPGGGCKSWDSYDIDTAIEVMVEDEEHGLDQ